MKKIEISINEQINIESALNERGFEIVEIGVNQEVEYLLLNEYIEILKKDDKYYGLVRYDDHNKFIYDAELVEATDLAELNSYKQNIQFDEYSEYLEEIGEVTLQEFDRICGNVFRDTDSCIFDYGPETIFEDELEEGKIVGIQGAFGYSNTYNVWFEVVKEAEEWRDMIVKFIRIEII